MSETSEQIDGALGAPPVKNPPVEENPPTPEPVDQVMVFVDGPWNLDRFIVEAPSGATLIIDRGGVLVDHLDVDAVVVMANANGVSLRIGK